DVFDLNMRRCQLEQHVERQRLLRWPPTVDGGFADARVRRDVLEAQVGEALLDKLALEGFEDGAVGPSAARSAAGPRQLNHDAYMIRSGSNMHEWWRSAVIYQVYVR